MKAQEVYRGNGPLVVLLSYHVNVADFRLVQGTGPEIPATIPGYPVAGPDPLKI